jgi:ATP-dependent helicase/nuclease subunit A
VGDAKQSIYRFRRAEVALFRKLAEETKERPGRAVLRLDQNFRSKPAILRFVNRAFGALIQESADTDQPRYEPISPQEGLGDEASVIALRFGAEPYAMGADLLRAEALALAAFVSRAAEGGYGVREPASGQLRPSRAGDVMVLARRLTQARYLEEALEASRVRFAVEGGKSFFDRQEVNEVLAVLRAVDDPSDRVSWVGALRSSFFGVSDRDIAGYALAGGRLGRGASDMD